MAQDAVELRVETTVSESEQEAAQQGDGDAERGNKGPVKTRGLAPPPLETPCVI